MILNTHPKIVGIIQARMGSKRFPDKMAKELAGYPIIQWVLKRVKQTELLDEIYLATSTNKENDYLVEEANKEKINYYRGDEENVLSRFICIANNSNAEIIVRICADNPFITASEIDRIIKHFIRTKSDYSFNHIPKKDNNYIDGIGVEVFSKLTLEEIYKKAFSTGDLEHVTKYIWSNPSEFVISTINAPIKYAYPKLKLDVDYNSDLEKFNKILLDISSEIKPETFDCLLLIQKMISQ